MGAINFPVVLLVYAIITLCVYDCYTAEDLWLQRKKSHKLQDLSPDALNQIAEMSSDSHQSSFKQDILKPFLRVRTPGSEGSLAVREHIKQWMSKLAWPIEEDSFKDMTPVGEKTFVNIVATHNLSSARRLVLACHYDSKSLPGAEFIGATDSAVPCAMMIDLAVLLNRSLSESTSQELTLQLMFFDGEEAFVRWTDSDSLYGSRHLAGKMSGQMVRVEHELTVSELETIDLLMLLDLIGTVDTRFANWFSKTQHLYKDLQRIENELHDSHLLQSTESNHYFTNNMYQSMEFSGGIQDDHIPFHGRGVPIVHLISYPFPSVWHQPSDNESALHYPTINDIGTIVRAFVVSYLGLDVSA